MTDPAALLKLVTDVPGIAYAIVLVLLVLELNRRSTENAKVNHAEWREHMDKESKADREALGENSRAISALATSIKDILHAQAESNKELSGAIKELTMAFDNQRSELRTLAGIVEARQERRGGTGKLGGL